MKGEWEPVGVLGEFDAVIDKWDLSDGDEVGWRYQTWLWCLHCYRLQQARTVRLTRGGYLLCSFADCDGTLIDLWECDDPQNEGVFPVASERRSGERYDIYENQQSSPPR